MREGMVDKFIRNAEWIGEGWGEHIEHNILSREHPPCCLTGITGGEDIAYIEVT